jgi:hypothetical protein
MHVGLRKKVRFLRELGFVYLDDGERIFRLSEPAFDGLRGACHDTPGALLKRYPSLFVTVRSPAEVERRFVQAEVA